MPVNKNWNERSFALCLVLYIFISIVVAALALDISFSIGEDALSSSSSTTNMTTVDGIRCDTVEFTKFHIHAHLDILVDGKQFILPSQIGIDPEGRCLYCYIHTTIAELFILNLLLRGSHQAPTLETSVS